MSNSLLERCQSGLVLQLLWNHIAALENEMSQLSQNRIELVTRHGDRGDSPSGNSLPVENLLSLS